MEETKEVSEIKKEKLKNWFSNKNNQILLGVVLFCLIVRLYFFFLAMNQPLWWDEAEYMAGAKAYAGMAEYELQAIRSPGLSLFGSFFYFVGIESEPALRFFLSFLPSLFALFLVYLTAAEMYKDKRIAVISVLILSVLWEHVFYSNRFHTENLSLIFEMLAIFVLVKCYIKEEKFLSINSKFWPVLVAIFTAISLFFRPGNAAFVPALFLFIIFVNYKKFTSKKGTAISLGVLVVLFFIGKYILSLPRETGFLWYLQNLNNPPSWNSLDIFQGFYASFIPSIPSLWYYAFLLGIVLCIIGIATDAKKVAAKTSDAEEIELKSDVFNFLLIFSVLFFFIFILRVPTFEYRWFFPLLIGMLVFSAKGMVFFSDILASTSKIKISSAILIIFLALGAYGQIIYTDTLIKAKRTSYSEIRDSGIWINQNSNPGDVIVSASQPQHSFYSERKVYSFGLDGLNPDEAEFTDEIQKIKPTFIVLSMIEKSPDWSYNWPQKHNETYIPVKVYFADPQQTQPVLIIYKFQSAKSVDEFNLLS